MNFKPGMILVYGKIFYKVEGIHLGIVGQVNLIRLSPVTEDGQGGNPDIFVPLKILEASMGQVPNDVSPLGKCYEEVIPSHAK